MLTLEEKKAERAAYTKAYQKTPAYKAKKSAYDKARRATPEGKAKKSAYQKASNVRPEVKAKKSARSKAYYATPEGKATHTAKSTRRRAAKLQQQPAWADQSAIDFVYFSAQVIKNAFGGVAPHVDHIVPLQGKDVRGLHVAENLQLLSAKANMQKSNK